MTRCDTSRSSGFALLMAMLLVALVSVALSGVARRSLSRANAANAAATDLQKRWGERSCEAAFVTLAVEQMNKREEKTREPVTQQAGTVTLGGVRFDLLVQDEDAKVNVNHLEAIIGEKSMGKAIRDMVRRVQRDAVPVRLEPLKASIGNAAQQRAMPRYGGYEQVFNMTPSAYLGSMTKPNATSTLFTCWGEGRVNYLRATPAALAAIGDGVIDDAQVSQIIAMRKANPKATMATLTSGLMLSKNDQAKLAGRLTDESRWYSLWTRVDDGQRERYRLAIMTVTKTELTDANANGKVDGPAMSRIVHEVFTW
ncbi:MAG: hypothetical protein GC162_07065 [Planctomycetes bacterium]|nr:hypothetical protein [Planctomycetota bacterium]